MTLTHPFRLHRAARFAFGGFVVAAICVLWIWVLANVGLFFLEKSFTPNSIEDAWAWTYGFIKLAAIFGGAAGIFGFFSATLKETTGWVRFTGIFFIAMCGGVGAYLLHLHMQSPLSLAYLAMMLMVLFVGIVFGAACLKSARSLAAKWLM